MYNFRIVNNYMFCDLPNGTIAEGGIKNVEIHLSDHTATAKVSCKNLNNWNNLVVDYSEITVEGASITIEAFITWVTENTQVFNAGGGEFDPTTYDLSEFNNESENAFVRENDLPIDFSLFPIEYYYYAISTAFQGIGTPSGLVVEGNQSYPYSTNSLTTRLRGTTTFATAGRNATVVSTTHYYISPFQGFYYEFRVEDIDEELVANSRCSYGLGQTAPLNNIEPSNSVNALLSIGHDSTDANFNVFYKNQGGICNKIDLGAGFPKNAGSKFRVVFWRLPNTTIVNYKVTNIVSQEVSIGTLEFTPPYPILTVNFYRNNNTTEKRVSFGIHQIKILVEDENV